MKKILILPILTFLMYSAAIGQTDLRMNFDYTYDSPDMQSLLSFENISFEKVSFTGAGLANKFFRLSIKQFTNGKLSKEEAMDSTNLGDVGKIKGSTFSFRVLTKTTAKKTVRFQFQFRELKGVQITKEFNVTENPEGFAMKNFVAAKNDVVIDPAGTYFLAYIQPYDKGDGIKTYCEVVSAKPEELGIKYPMPNYFLVEIKFK